MKNKVSNIKLEKNKRTICNTCLSRNFFMYKTKIRNFQYGNLRYRQSLDVKCSRLRFYKYSYLHFNSRVVKNKKYSFSKVVTNTNGGYSLVIVCCNCGYRKKIQEVSKIKEASIIKKKL